jgi:CRISPR-associated protein Cst2
MNLWSISFSYRLGLGFHALNNEGAEGSNLMQPRRIDVGKITYDGISGEMIRRHILENFVNICRANKINMLPLSEALHPDRGALGIRQVAKKLKVDKLTKINPQDLYQSVRNAIVDCGVLDVGGYLAAFSEKKEETTDSTGASKAKAPEDMVLKNMADLGNKTEGAPYTVKRDSVFDVGWLISEQPQDVAITQHSAYRPSGQQSLYSQTMRSNVYGGIIRADLHRIGTDDYWYLQPGQDRLAISTKKQQERQTALIEAIANFIAAPTGAKTAGWAPHVFLTEGAILLSANRTAPFVSPIKVCLNDSEHPVQSNGQYLETMKKFVEDEQTWVENFVDTKQLLAGVQKIIKILEGKENGGPKNQ